MIHELKDFGLSNRKIAKRINRGETVVRNFLKKGESYGVRKKNKGNSKISNRDRNRIIELGETGRFNASEIKQELDLPITRRRVSQILRGSGHLVYTKKAKKPNLTSKHIQARLEFARQHMDWRAEWDNVVFSDEKKFNLDGPDCCAYYWHDLRKDPQVKSTRNFGGGTLMVWIGFSRRGKTPIATISTKMNSDNYIELLDSVLIPFMENKMDDNFIFQQDNAAIHVSKKTMSWFSERNIRVMEWPARSPDLNPVENLWGILARRVYSGGRQFGTVSALQKCVREEWNKIQQTTLDNLIDTMPNRIFETIRKNGKTTKY